MAACARLLSVNLAEVRSFHHRGREVRTGIWKRPHTGPVRVELEGLGGDAVVDSRYHGGVEKAVYAYAQEDYEWWRAELEGMGHPPEPGLFGENLTVSGLDLSDARIGERWRVGSCLLEVSEPRTPCFKLAHKLGDPRFVRRFARVLRLGAYLRVVEAGSLAAGDAVEVTTRPDHAVSARLLGRVMLGEHDLAGRALAAPAIAPARRAWLESKVLGTTS